MYKKMGVTAIITFLLFCACQTSPIVWDNDYPPEKLATVLFMDMKIDSYNGINVKKFLFVKIPAGEATFGGEITMRHGGVAFRAKDMEFTCILEEGKEYIVQGSNEDMKWGVSLYEAASYTPVKIEKRVRFTSFKNQPKFL